jgi:hypothetical protein
VAKAYSPDDLAARTFWITTVGLLAWILAVFIFIL